MSGTCPTYGHDMCVCDTGGQPAPESVVEASQESAGQLTSAEHWVLSRPWRHGDRYNSVVCDPRHGREPSGYVEFFGGLCVLEGCSSGVRDHIIGLHNASLREQLEAMG